MYLKAGGAGMPVALMQMTSNGVKFAGTFFILSKGNCDDNVLDSFVILLVISGRYKR